ncbi:HNH endonuclease family protein [Aeromonas enteropelogenes]|uniref:HNH endonuclease family protein n=1 Tax=Aeromonas enteropelogenes TaxID=29489 RepID=UPI003BA1343E
MAEKIYLDALIPREDFEVKDEQSGTTRNISTIGARDLEYDSFFFSALRKPDFQRETNEWDSKRIISLIDSFISGDLIPAVILWRSSSSYTFVIDGAHRLSALAAWINNDYGDGEISKEFYDGIIPNEQIIAAENTRREIRKKIGLFSDYQLALRNPSKVDPKIVEISKSLGALAIQVQWVEGDAKKAENSFFKINQQAASIDKTELKLLRARRKPAGIATRAILRSGKGHKYWSSYPEEIQESIQELAEELNEIMFQPTLKNPIKTLDLPLGGKNFSAQGQSLILELVNKTNIDQQHEEDDTDGQGTLKCLKNCLYIVRKINSKHPSSLGLHPAIYFYSKDGKHKPASFWATIELIQHLDKAQKLNWFIAVRENFEIFLLKNDYIIQQVVRKHRSASAAYPYVTKLYLLVLESLHSGVEVDNLPNVIKTSQDYSYITSSDLGGEDVTSKDFSRERKSEVFMRDALAAALKCKICGGHLHSNSISIDHLKRKEDGGIGNVENGQLTHLYCNTTYKN